MILFVNGFINPPIIAFPNETRVMNVLPPAELHLMLGTVNYLFDLLETKCKEASQNWMKQCHLKSQHYHGQCFNGNECKKLLKNIHLLQDIMPLGFRDIVLAFIYLNVNVSSTFGN